MNNPEVTMHGQQQPNRFDALEKATTAAGIAISLVMRVPAPLKPIADQVIRSASSVPANLAEGAGRSGRDRIHHWRIAYGSAKEVLVLHDQRRDFPILGWPMYVAETVTEAAQGTRESASLGRAGYDIVPQQPPGTAAHRAQCHTGLPREAR
jgi:four helix bundle protein